MDAITGRNIFRDTMPINNGVLRFNEWINDKKGGNCQICWLKRIVDHEAGKFTDVV